MWSSGQMAEVRRRVEQAGWQECVVINHNRVVLGLLNREAWLAGDELPAEEAMDPAPLTLRPHFLWESVLEKNAHAKNPHCVGHQARR